MLFEPKHEALEPSGIGAHECLLSIQKDGTVMIPVDNFQGIQAKLDKGVEIGVVSVVRVDDKESECGNVSVDGEETGGEAVVGTKCDRMEAIMSGLDFDHDYLSEMEVGRVKEVLSDFQDVFARSWDVQSWYSIT